MSVTNILGDAPRPKRTHDKPVFDANVYVSYGERYVPDGDTDKKYYRDVGILVSCFGRDLPAVAIQLAFERGQSDAANGIHQNPYSSCPCFAWLRGYHLGGGKKDKIMPLLPRYRKSSRWVSDDLSLECVWGEHFWQGENDDDQNSYFASGLARLFVGRNPVPGCYRLSEGKTGAAADPEWYWKPQREFISRRSEFVKPDPPGQSWDDFMQDEEMYFWMAA